MLGILRAYWKQTRPEHWLFPGPDRVRPITTRSVERACRKAAEAFLRDLAVFGDMNQEGVLDGPKCGVKQNGRGGLFFAVEDAAIAKSLRILMSDAE